jgi:hypothetical protein
VSRANPFADLDDFAPERPARPVPVAAIEKIARDSGFPSRTPRTGAGAGEGAGEGEGVVTPGHPAPPHARRRYTTGRNRQINIKATEDTIATLYRLADEHSLPLGAVLEKALRALEKTK